MKGPGAVDWGEETEEAVEARGGDAVLAGWVGEEASVAVVVVVVDVTEAEDGWGGLWGGAVEAILARLGRLMMVYVIRYGRKCLHLYHELSRRCWASADCMLCLGISIGSWGMRGSSSPTRLRGHMSPFSPPPSKSVLVATLSIWI